MEKNNKEFYKFDKSAKVIMTANMQKAQKDGKARINRLLSRYKKEENREEETNNEE